MQIEELIEAIKKDVSCRLFPSNGMPVVGDGVALPRDLAKFYTVCGGMELFQTERFGFRIVTPQEFVPANPLLLGEYYRDHKQEYDADRSSAWYLIARGKDPNLAVVIDLDAQRNGHCYDGFWEVYATGNSKMVALSFTELIERLYAVRGADLYWEHSNFDLGHAYG